MNRTQLEEYIYEAYGTKAEYPWFKYPTFAVFRHESNSKWFAVVMDIPKSKLGLRSEDLITVMNLKCDFFVLCSLLDEEGFFPAYHMNKNNWISVAIDGSVDENKIKRLLQTSFELTRAKKK